MKTIVNGTFEWPYSIWAQLTFLDLEFFFLMEFFFDVLVKFTLAVVFFYKPPFHLLFLGLVNLEKSFFSRYMCTFIKQ